MRYKVTAQALDSRKSVLATFSKSYRSFKTAARQATQYAKLYGHAQVIDTRAPTARGYLMACTGTAEQRRRRGSFAKCTLSSEAKALLKRKRRSRARR